MSVACIQAASRITSELTFIELEHGSFHIADSSNQNFRIKATLDDSGIISFTVVTKVDGKRSHFRGEQLFRGMMTHFDGRVEGILGQWSTTGIATDNLSLVNMMTKQPGSITLREAISETWTAKQAAGHGYSEFVIIEKKGSKGKYSSLDVLFYAPGNKPASFRGKPL